MPRATVLFRLLVAGLLLPAVLLTGLRLAAPDPGVLVRLTSFVPLAIPLYALALLLVTVKALFPGRESTRLWLGVLMVPVVGLAAHVSWISPQFLGDAPAAGNGVRSVQVMTANLLVGRADAAMVVRSAAVERVEILVLQEVTPEALRELEEFGVDEAYPHRAGEPADGVRGTMVFSTYRIREVERLDTGFGSWAMNVVLPEGQLRLYAVHTRPPLGDAEDWREDLEALVDAAEADRQLDLAVGDFNATSDHDLFRRFADDADLHSAAERANSGWQPTWPEHGERKVWGVPLPRVVQIDHVLVGRTMTALATDTVSIDDTDHRAVVAEVAFR